MDVVSWTFTDESYDQNKPVLIDAANTSVNLSATQARRLVKELIAGLKAAGLQKDDAVCILSFGTILYPIFYLAIIGAGGRVAAGNPGYTAFEVQHLLSTCSVKFAIASTSTSRTILEASAAYGLPSQHIYFHDGSLETESKELRDLPGSCQSWGDLLKHGSSDWQYFKDTEEAATTVASLCSTSGTTGSPKFAAIPHANYITTSEYLRQDTTNKSYAVSRLIALPLMHAFAAPLVHFAALRSGVPTYIMSRFSIADFLKVIKENQITEIPVVPSILASLLASPLTTKDSLSSLREILSAGAPLSSSVAKDFSALLHSDARLSQIYGLTEAGWIASSQTGALCSDINESMLSGTIQQPTVSIGIPLSGAGIELTLESTTTRDLQPANQPGASGEILIKVPHPFLYYLNNPSATTAAFTQDKQWLRSGDLATVDASGRLFIVDRIKDLIKVRGWQVAPVEIEDVLLTHPDVTDVAVIGLPGDTNQPQNGEVPCAFVVKREGVDVGGLEGELRALARSRLASYKMPARIEWVESIPRNPAGKILKWKLAQNVGARREPGLDAKKGGGGEAAHVQPNTDMAKVVSVTKAAEVSSESENSTGRLDQDWKVDRQGSKERSSFLSRLAAKLRAVFCRS